MGSFGACLLSWEHYFWAHSELWLYNTTGSHWQSVWIYIVHYYSRYYTLPLRYCSKINHWGTALYLHPIWGTYRKSLPGKDDNKVHDVPDVPEVGARVQHKPQGQNLHTMFKIKEANQSFIKTLGYSQLKRPKLLSPSHPFGSKGKMSAALKLQTLSSRE